LKKIHLVGIFFGGFLILFSLFAFPKYNTLRLSAKSLEAGSEKLKNGEIVSGLSLVQHAISTLKTQNVMHANMMDGIKEKLIDTAQKYPLKSFMILEFLDKNGIQPDCDERMTMYRTALEEAIQSAKNSKIEEMRESLNIAALWSGSCAVDEKNLTGFKKIFDYYKKASGASFIRADWMALAYEGKPIYTVSSPPQTPSSNLAEKAGANQIAGLFDKVKQKVGMSKSTATSQTEKPETPPIAAKPATQPEVPAAPQAKTPDKSTKPEATAKTPAPSREPSSEQKTAPTAAAKTPPPIVSNKQSPDTKKEQSGTSKTGGINKQEATQNFMQKVMKAPGLIISRVKNLINRAPKQEPTIETPKDPKVIIISPALSKEIQSATSDMIEEYRKTGITVSRAEFSADGAIVFIEFSSKHIGTGILADELAQVLSTIDERVRKTGIIPLKIMSITLLNGNEKNSSVVKWDIGYDEYCKFRDKKIDAGEFRKSWGETLY